MKPIKGNIVKHIYRKSGLYLVINNPESDGVAKLVRVKKGRLYPIAATKTTFMEGDYTKLSKVAHARNHAKKSEEEISSQRREAFSTRPGLSGWAERNNANVELTVNQKAQFANLAGALSPENLSCDGELSRSATQAKYTKLMNKWHKLEREVGRKVDEGEVWKWHESPQKEAIQAECDKLSRAEFNKMFGRAS